MTTQLIGYGQFHLEAFRPGEEFSRFDGTLGKVCEEQPYRTPSACCNQSFLPEHLWVWVQYGTSNANRMFLHRRALVHAVTSEQARQIARRLRNRKEH